MKLNLYLVLLLLVAVVVSGFVALVRKRARDLGKIEISAKRRMEMTKLPLLGAVIVSFSLITLDLSAQPFSQVLNQYNCVGIGDSGEYKYVLKTRKEQDNYFLEWGNNGSTDYQGMGFLLGSHLAVVFVARPIVGVLLYEVRPGQLVGSWAFGDGKIYKEVCTAGIQAKGEPDENPSENPTQSAR